MSQEPTLSEAIRTREQYKQELLNFHKNLTTDDDSGFNSKKMETSVSECLKRIDELDRVISNYTDALNNGQVSINQS